MHTANPYLAHPERLHVVRDWTSIWVETESAFTRTASLAARIYGLPIGYVTLVGQHSYRIVGSHGLPLRPDKQRLPDRLEIVFPASFTQSSDAVTLADVSIVLGESCKHRVASKPGLIAWQDGDRAVSTPVGFHAAVPLTHRDGHVLGSLNVVGHAPCSFTLDEVAMLEDLAESLVCELEARAANAIWRVGRVPSTAEAHLLAVIESAHEAIITESLDGVVKSWNAAAERMFGYSSREVIGQNIAFLIPGGNEERIRTLLGRIARGEHIEPFETHRRHKLGHEVPVRVSISPISAADGTVIGASSFTSDRSEERHTIEKLESTSARLHSIITELPITVFAVDSRGYFTLCEGNGIVALGITPEELVGRSSFEVLERNPNALKAVRRALDGERFRGIFEWDALVLECSFSPLVDGGRTVGATAVAMDVTDRSRDAASLHLMRSSMAGVSEAVLITDADLEAPGPRIVYANPAFCAMTGYQPHELLGRSPRLLQGPATEASTLDRLRQALRAGEAFTGSAINYAKDGTPYEVEWRIQPVRDAAGRITHFSSTHHNVSERNRVAKALRELAFYTDGTSMAGTFEHPINMTHYDLPLPLLDLEENLHRIRQVAESRPGMHGRLEEVGGAGGLVQMLSLVHPSGLLRVDAVSVWFQNGRVVHIQHPTLEGADAVIDTFTREHGRFVYEPNHQPPLTTLDLDAATLVIEAAMRQAEAGARIGVLLETRREEPA
jgi:PAS domain S-box-containing protein